MRFKVRSLGGKLIFITGLTLLLCMILFSALSWGLLKFLSEREARSDATTHLASIKKSYQSQTTRLMLDLQQVAENTDITSTVSQPSTPSTRNLLRATLVPFLMQHPNLLSADIFNKLHHLVGNLEDGINRSYLNSATCCTADVVGTRTSDGLILFGIIGIPMAGVCRVSSISMGRVGMPMCDV